MEVVSLELERRMEMFYGAGVEHLRRWNEEHPGERMPYVVVCVDRAGRAHR